jgi:hypothetical protein
VERRKHNRLKIEFPVRCKILDKAKKNEISYNIFSKTCDLSEGGACLSWPKSWSCEVCSNCLAWIFNHSCTLKEEPYKEESNKYLTTSTFIQVELEPPAVPEPLKVTAKVAWVKPQGDKDEYGIGLSFLEGKKGELNELKERISALKDKESS